MAAQPAKSSVTKSPAGEAGQRVDAQVIVARLLAAADRGQMLGDPRVAGTIAAWASICQGVADDTIRQLIPGIIRLLFRKHDIKPRLEKAGLRDAVALQHEAIAPYVISFRRMQAMKASGGEMSPGQLLAETRKELRELGQRFHAALDQAIALQEENKKLRHAVQHAREQTADAEKRAGSAQQQADKYKKDASAFFNELEDTRAKALGKLKYALENLREALDLKVNDPDSTLVASASLSVQSYYMVCEDLGRGTDALKLSRSILGDKASAIGL